MVSYIKSKINKKHLKYDILSGFIVSLIALPLCLGIAAASNFPPITGVLTSIIGGLIIGFFSGSELAIKGPAAGLIVIVAGAVEEFGRGDMQQGYVLTASLIAITGLVQIILGLAKIGKFADFIPSSVIHGMLAAIGIIIMSKQIHFLIGITPAEIKGLHPIQLIEHIPASFMHLEWHIALIGITSLILLIVLPRIKNRVLQTIPSFLIVILVSIVIAQIFHFSTEKKLYNSLINPGKLSYNFFFNTGIFSSENLSITIKYFFLLSIIGTIESMLTVKAVDLLDPYKRTSNHNKDIIALGFGNLLAGLMGALPMISEVARSSANINNKGVSRLSGIMHGAFLMLFVLIFVSVIKLIPVAALSSILIFVGFKLAHPKSFIHAYKVSNEHLLVFVTTTVVTLVEDLLVGVVAGIVLKMFINMIKSGEIGKLFRSKLNIEEKDNQLIIQLDSAAVFTNWLSLKSILENETDRKIIIDFKEVKIVDTSFIENLNRFKEKYKGEVILRSFNDLRAVKNDEVSMRVKSDQNEVITIHLSDYERRMKAYCEEHIYIISFRTMIPKSYISNFKGFKHSDIKQTSLHITGIKHNVKFEYFESTIYDSVNMFEYHANVLGIEFGNKLAPRFLMQKETKFDSVLEFIMKNQVVFQNHHLFNSRYSVYSSQKQLATALFCDELIEYFEQNDIKDKVIEGDGKHKMIIYNNGKCLDTESFEKKLELGLKIFELSNALENKEVEMVK
jgi:MFS superfamily sulfate permease-like transporter